MGIIELDSDLVRELGPSALRLLEPPDNVIERGGHPEILLLETELFPSLEVVVGVEDGADRLGALLLGDGALVVPIIELLEVELAAGCLARPEPQVVRRGGGVPRDRDVIGDGRHRLPSLPVRLDFALCVGRLVGAPVELDLKACVLFNVLPVSKESGDLHPQ